MTPSKALAALLDNTARHDGRTAVAIDYAMATGDSIAQLLREAAYRTARDELGTGDLDAVTARHNELLALASPAYAERQAYARTLTFLGWSSYRNGELRYAEPETVEPLFPNGQPPADFTVKNSPTYGEGRVYKDQPGATQYDNGNGNYSVQIWDN